MLHLTEDGTSIGRRNQIMTGVKVRVTLRPYWQWGLRPGEICRLKAGDINSAQKIIRIIQSKGAKTGMSCCRGAYWPCCGNGGRSASRQRKG